MADTQLDHAVYLTALSEYSSTELTELERAVTDTMNTRGWVVLEELWGGIERSTLDALIRSRSDQVEDFVSKTAFVRGLRTAREASNALAKEAERKRREATDER